MILEDATNRWNKFCDTVNNFNYSNEAQCELVLTNLDIEMAPDNKDGMCLSDSIICSNLVIVKIWRLIVPS